MYAEIIAAINSARALGDLVGAARQLSNYNELVAAVADVNAKLMTATGVALASQEQQATLAARVRELENAAAEHQEFARQMERYNLHRFETGGLAYAYQAPAGDGQPMHYLCATCADNRQIAKLQPAGEGALRCPQCRFAIRTAPQRPFNRPVIRSPYL